VEYAFWGAEMVSPGDQLIAGHSGLRFDGLRFGVPHREPMNRFRCAKKQVESADRFKEREAPARPGPLFHVGNLRDLV
jgi:hypothetical protein